MRSILRSAASIPLLAGLLLGVPACNILHAGNAHYPPPFPRKGAVKVLENCRVIVWNVTWPKGHWSAVHRHDRDAVIVTLAGGTVETMTPDGKTKLLSDQAGHVTFFPKGVIHKEMGLSNPPRHAIVIELKPPRAGCHA
jgi:quercetin dioxygenase-like cupin family protein